MYVIEFFSIVPSYYKEDREGDPGRTRFINEATKFDSYAYALIVAQEIEDSYGRKSTVKELSLNRKANAPRNPNETPRPQ